MGCVDGGARGRATHQPRTQRWVQNNRRRDFLVDHAVELLAELRAGLVGSRPGPDQFSPAPFISGRVPAIHPQYLPLAGTLTEAISPLLIVNPYGLFVT